MSEFLPKRKGASALSTKYSDEELESLYEMGRFLLEIGEHHLAKTISEGLVKVAPSMGVAYLLQAYCLLAVNDFDGALECARQAGELDETLKVESNLYEATALLRKEEYLQMGTVLGEVQDILAREAPRTPLVNTLLNVLLSSYTAVTRAAG